MGTAHRLHIVTDTSAEAHDAHYRQGKSRAQQARILELFDEVTLREVGFTRREIAQRFARQGEADLAQVSTVSARVNELIKAGLLVCDGKRECCVTQKLAERLNRPQGQRELF